MLQNIQLLEKKRETGPMITMLKSLVRSKMEYVSILWSPT